MTFGVRKFLSLLLSGTLTIFLGYCIRLTDAIVLGHVIGEDALSGIIATMPLLSVVTFVAWIVASGTGTLYSTCLGRLDGVRARCYFTQGLWLALIFGSALSLLMFFCWRPYMAWLGASEYVTMYMGQYLGWAWPTGLLECILLLLLSLGYNDGDTGLCLTAYAVTFAVNAVSSYLSVRLGMGASGCALGSIVAECIGIAVCFLHFFRTCNTYRPIRWFSLKDSWRIVSLAFGDAAAFLCDGMLALVLAEITVIRFDSDVMPVTSVAVVLWMILELFNGVGVAVQPIVSVYFGERNTRAIRSVMRAAVVVAIFEGLLATVVLAVFPNLLVGMLGIEYEDLIAPSLACVRGMSIGFVALSLAGLFNSYYLFVGHWRSSAFLTLTCYLLLPAVFTWGFSAYGLTAMWIGLGLGPVVGLCVFGLQLLCRYGKSRFPLLLEAGRDRRIRVFGLKVEERDIMAVSQKVAKEVPPELAPKVSLLVEEVYMAVKDGNPGRCLYGEVTVDRNDGVCLTLRDDGKIFDITDSDAAISSLRTFFVASIMERQTSRGNYITTGFNRNVFKLA